MFFSGKGGVGKTTCAAAYAIRAARAGQHVLVVSTDPAHSLGDALGVSLHSRPVTVALDRSRALDAAELDAPRAFARWLSQHRQSLIEIVEHGSWLDRGDIESLLGLSMPGVDELAAMLEIVRLSRRSVSAKTAAAQKRARPYDLVILDAAPTGHTLRLLAAPEATGAAAAALEGLQQEYRLIREQLARVHRVDAADRLIASLTEQAADARRLLQDGRRLAFHWVTLPEDLALAETADGLRALDAARIRVAEVIVNRVLRDGRGCPMCDRRRTLERALLSGLRRSVGRRSVRFLPAVDPEPKGILRLTAFSKLLTPRSGGDAVGRGEPRGGRRRSSVKIVFSRPRSSPVLSAAAFDGVKLILVGGKGGVGKTTTAAALAIALALRTPARRILLLSTDPAHSLGDAFDQTVGDAPMTPSREMPNLHVRELDAPAAWAARKAGIEPALNETLHTFGAASMTLSGGGFSDLMDLAPPGIDELLALVSVSELMRDETHEQSYETLVVDLAPTGHALRLLEMPDAAREWVQVLMRMLLKYREVVRPGQLASELLTLSKSINRLRALLRNPKDTRVVVVTRATEVTRIETLRFVNRLRRLRFAGGAFLVVNALTLAPGRCRWCRKTAAGERHQFGLMARAFRRTLRECVIIQAPLAAPPPRGVAALRLWATTWIAERIFIA